MAYTFAIVHHAGGVGKTTTALNLGYELAARDQTVLLVDLDPQADLTLRLAPDGPPSDLPAALLTGANLGRHPFGWRSGVRVYLVPSNLEAMAGLEMQLMAAQRREDRLARALGALRGWDYILLDCPPALNLLTVNALYAADGALVPVQAQDKALRQLGPLLKSLIDVQGFRGGPPVLAGLLLTMADRTEQAADTERSLRAAYPDQVYQTVIPRSTHAADDGRYQQPVACYAPTNPVALAYAALAEEILAHA